MRRKALRLLENAFLRLWWVVLFFLACCALFERAVKKTDLEYERLFEQLVQLKSEKEKALSIQESLLLQINSESDPAWIELTLMKGLGLVPEDQTKIFFTK